jgi:3-methyladenine DNA glycosylase AlkC
MAAKKPLTPYKEYFGLKLAERLSTDIVTVRPAFDREAFLADIAPKIGPLELKARVALLAEGLRAHLPRNYPGALKVLLKILGPENPGVSGAFNFGSRFMPVALFVERYGLDDYDLSMEALAEITKRHTSEYAVRPYIAADPKRALKYLRGWAKDPNPHLRRLVSEGPRPRLPWASKLTTFLDGPEPIMALLEKLRTDSSPYVRKSVANHLKDYYRLIPARIDALVGAWPDRGEDAAWVMNKVEDYRVEFLT